MVRRVLRYHRTAPDTEEAAGANPYGKPPSQPVDTSEDAADSMIPVADTLRGKVYHYLWTRGREGATDNEIELTLGIRRQTVTPRRRELVLKGLIVDSGIRRKTESNRSAIVWVVRIT